MSPRNFHTHTHSEIHHRGILFPFTSISIFNEGLKAHGKHLWEKFVIRYFASRFKFHFFLGLVADLSVIMATVIVVCIRHQNYYYCLHIIPHSKELLYEFLRWIFTQVLRHLEINPFHFIFVRLISAVAF